MIYFICDNCNKVVSGNPDVILKGVSGTSGGILLPEKYIEKHFCCPTCFWRWSIKYNPLTPEKQRQKEIDKLKRLKQIKTLDDNSSDAPVYDVPTSQECFADSVWNEDSITKDEE